MKLLYGTENTAKLDHMKRMLAHTGIHLLGLRDMESPAPTVEEHGADPLENARIKAYAYYQAFHVPVFSCDSGLFLDGVPPEQQPGVHVRRVNGKRMDDEEMIAHYAGLAHQAGGHVRATYRNAICLVLDETRVCVHDGPDISFRSFLIAEKPHPRRIPGYPLDSLSLNLRTGNYYLDEKKDNAWDDAIGEGFRLFFSQALGETGAHSPHEGHQNAGNLVWGNM